MKIKMKTCLMLTILVMIPTLLYAEEKSGLSFEKTNLSKDLLRNMVSGHQLTDRAYEFLYDLVIAETLNLTSITEHSLYLDVSYLDNNEPKNERFVYFFDSLETIKNILNRYQEKRILGPVDPNVYGEEYVELGNSLIHYLSDQADWKSKVGIFSPYVDPATFHYSSLINAIIFHEKPRNDHYWIFYKKLHKVENQAKKLGAGLNNRVMDFLYYWVDHPEQVCWSMNGERLAIYTPDAISYYYKDDNIPRIIEVLLQYGITKKCTEDETEL